MRLKIVDYQYCGESDQGLYFVKWVGWDSADNTWEPQAHIECREVLVAFYKARLQERENATPPDKVKLELPPDPRETHQIRQEFNGIGMGRVCLPDAPARKRGRPPGNAGAIAKKTKVVPKWKVEDDSESDSAYSDGKIERIGTGQVHLPDVPAMKRGRPPGTGTGQIGIP